MDNFDTVRGPTIDRARRMRGGRISVDSAECSRDGNSSYPVIMYQGGIYLLCGGNSDGSRKHFHDITPDEPEFAAIDSLSLPNGSINGPVSGKKNRYA